MPQEPKRPVSELKPAELRTIEHEIQKLLWQDEFATDEQRSNGGSTRFWNTHKEWPHWTTKAIADVLDDHGLKPIDPPVVTGTTHKLDYDDEPIPADYSDDPDNEHWTPHYRPPTS